MLQTTVLKEKLNSGDYDRLLADLYCGGALDGNDAVLQRQKSRYIAAVEAFEKQFGESEVEIYSAPGRSEICGNHTDHQGGRVLAAAVNLDIIAVVSCFDCVEVISEGFGKVSFFLDDMDCRKEEWGTTLSLIKGVLAGFHKRGYAVGGFRAYITGDVMAGAGLSSSAAFEVLIGTILSHLYNGGRIAATEIAQIGQYAENVYFGKPCGLMDQMASAVGSMVYMDFYEEDNPKVHRIEPFLEKHDYCLCITDTHGSHADLTEEYGAIPREMEAVAEFFGQKKLSRVNEEEFYRNLKHVREVCKDRAVLRAMHYFEENKRVDTAFKAAKQGDIELFLEQIKKSGGSSCRYLQNAYCNKNVQCQDITVALAISEGILGDKGVARLHGGGFAGTVQAFVPGGFVEMYRKAMDDCFGAGSCLVLQVRKQGGIRVI